MIILTRLNGDQFAINCDLVERVDSHPDTVLTLVDATKYVVAESLTEVIERVRDFPRPPSTFPRCWPGRPCSTGISPGR